jgi:methylase of polypeptide subunit release factors
MPKTYNDIYIETRNILRDNGVESCALEARVITCIASGKTNTELLRDLTLYSSPEIEQAAEDMVKRRLLGEPVAYITGSWEFYGLPFYGDARRAHSTNGHGGAGGRRASESIDGRKDGRAHT